MTGTEASARRILLFGGTTEGRVLAERLLAEGLPCMVCVATEYGAQVMASHPLLTVHTGRMDRMQMAELMRSEDFVCAADATHPFAAAATREIREACQQTGLPYLRLQRSISGEEASCIFVRDIEEAGAFLAAAKGTILVTTGSKELETFVRVLGDPSRVAARVLPSPESLESCRRAGLRGKQILAMQGPFAVDMNCAQLRHTGASWLLTKETGETGGYPAKLEAARQCGVHVVAIRPPQSDESTQQNPAIPGPAGGAGGDTGDTAAADPAGLAPEEAFARILQYVSVEKAEPAGEKTEPAGEAECVSAEKTEPAGEAEYVSAEKAEPAGEVEYVSVEKAEPAGEVAYVPAEKAEPAGEAECVPAEKNEPAVDAGTAEGSGMAVKTHSTAGETEEAVRRRKGRKLFLVGTGVGAPEALTSGARSAIASAEVLFGAQSVLRVLTETCPAAAGKKIIPTYESAAILQYLRDDPQIRCAAVAYSGDSGFYSGASSLLALFKEQKEKRQNDDDLPQEADFRQDDDNLLQATDFRQEANDPPREKDFRQNAGDPLRDLEISVVCGISCISWFAARIGVPWQDWKILSSHGRICNIVGHVRRNARCFVLLSGLEDLHRTGALLWKAQKEGMLGVLQVTYGYELSRPAEKIRCCAPRDLMEVTGEGLYVLFIENELFMDMPVLPGMDDSAFLRGEAPMTSAEVRALSLSRLGLTPQAFVWDVGAGTGSVSVEAALACPDAKVWSVEYKKKALRLLQENKERFCLQNMEIVNGRAPEILRELPAPTHVFIGGSGGAIEEILRIVFWKNPGARVVVNCITSETLAALQTALGHLRIKDVECTQIIVNRESRLGQYHYLRASNPVFIISFQGRGSRFAAEYMAGRESRTETE